MADKRLGRGLDFLISKTTTPAEPDSPPTEAEEAVSAPLSPAGPRLVSVESIAPNPFQPRREFAPEALADLEASIREHGILQPVMLREVEEGFQLVAGERRWRASKSVGLEEMPAIVREVSDEDMLALALVENIQRENLNPIETARAYRDMMARATLTQEEVARLVGKGRATVANTLRLLDLPEDLQEHVSRGTLTAGHARALLATSDEAAMRTLAARILEEGLSVREAERLATSPDGDAAEVAPAAKPIKERSSHLDELEDQLRTSIGARVAIQPGRGKKGKIVLYYATLEDFDRIYEILTGGEDTSL
ncbi:MAG: ParB/RepB/Spo0J family partition protein [Planctomycetota bacterium]|jgi:ParB family chromosome partitioning protein